MKPSYNDFADDFDALFQDVSQLTHLEGQALDNILKPYHVRTVLDCACGTGIQSIGMARFGYQVSASDISPRMVRLLQQKAKAEGVDILARSADFRNLRPWRGQTFDAVVCSGNSLTLMKSDEDIARSLRSMIARARKPGGLLVVGIHNYLVSRDQGIKVLIRRAEMDENSGSLLLDMRFYGKHRAQVTHFFISRPGKRWRLKTHTKSYWMMDPEDLRQRMLAVGCRDVRLVDISGQHAYSNEEWALAVGET